MTLPQPGFEEREGQVGMFGPKSSNLKREGAGQESPAWRLSDGQSK